MTSHSLTSPTPAPAPAPAPIRGELRLALSSAPGTATLDGGWWPWTRDIAVELADLVDHFPAELGRVHRAVFSPPDWDTAPRAVPVARGRIKTGSFPSDDTRMIVLRMSTHQDLRILVVPPVHPAGEQAMSIAADPANRWSPTQILAAGPFDELDDLGNRESADAADHWTDEGGSWWAYPEMGPPSYR
jgi:hypothetical protein